MADYNNFTQVLRDRKGTPEKRVPFVTNWLRKTYGIDFDVNPEYFSELTRPHDHDNQPLHFGQVPIETSFGSATAELAKDAKGQWRIAVTDPETKVRTVLSSEAEASEGNRDVRLRFVTLLASDSPQPEGEVIMMPAQMADGLTFKPGNGGRYGNIGVLFNSSAASEGGLGASVHPAHLPDYLTQADKEPRGLPVDVSRYMARA